MLVIPQKISERSSRDLVTTMDLQWHSDFYKQNSHGKPMKSGCHYFQRSHKVYTKRSHTHLDLNKLSNHHQRQKISVLRTLVYSATNICEPEHRADELNQLQITFINDSYNKRQLQ